MTATGSECRVVEACLASAAGPGRAVVQRGCRPLIQRDRRPLGHANQGRVLRGIVRPRRVHEFVGHSTWVALLRWHNSNSSSIGHEVAGTTVAMRCGEVKLAMRSLRQV
jgi:hypothetical protein